VDSESGPQRPSPFACRVPGKARARLQQKLGIVGLKAGTADMRIGLYNAAGVEEIICATARVFIPAVGELVSQTNAEVQIAPEVDLVLLGWGQGWPE